LRFGEACARLEFQRLTVLLCPQDQLFRFGIDLLKDVPEDEQAEVAADFAVDDDVLESFFDWVEDKEIISTENLTSLKANEQDVIDVKLGIRVEVLNATLGLDAGYKAALETDEQFRAALEHLPEGQDFWISWQAANLD